MQKLRYSIYLKGFFILLDALLVVGIFLTVYWQVLIDKSWEDLFLYALILGFLWFFISGSTKIYSIPRNFTLTLYLERIFIHLSFFLLGYYILISLGKKEVFIESFWRVSIPMIIVFIALKIIILFSLKYYRSLGKNVRNIMLLGESDSISLLEEIVKSRKDYGYKLFNYPKYSADITDLKNFWIKNGIYSVFIPINHQFNASEYEAIIEAAEDCGVSVSLIPNDGYDQQFKYELEFFDVQPVLKVVEAPLESPSNYFLKRCFDIVFSLLVLLLIGVWLFPIVALFIVLDSKGPIIFKQKRYGYRNRVFNCLKFRSMYPNTGANCKTTVQNDQRITKVGFFLRRTSLDEFPQFINVLMGQMSIVGPRPHMLSVDDFYKESIKKYNIRNSVKPGITGLAQIKGYRGERKDMHLEMRKRIKADIFYIKNWSFSLDLIIIVKTFVLFLFGDNKAY